MAGKSFWMILYYVLLVVFIVAAALNMLHLRGGFFTNHAADVVVPAWLYVVIRGLHPAREHRNILQRIFGRSPEIAAASLFIGSTITELSQRFWPAGIFAGRFDILDVAAYGAGVGGCYVAEKVLAARQAAVAAP
jgi:hypothetical protein